MISQVKPDKSFTLVRNPYFRQLRHRSRPDHPVLHYAAGQAAATCQILPADFPGHQAYCPYTTGAADGAWHGPG
jgi:hypothetical protein